MFHTIHLESHMTRDATMSKIDFTICESLSRGPFRFLPERYNTDYNH